MRREQKSGGVRTRLAPSSVGRTFVKKLLLAGMAMAILGAATCVTLWKIERLWKDHSFSAHPGQLAALQELRDSGVITAQEYDSRLQALRASAPAAPQESQKTAALKELRDSGVLTGQEYDAKIQALQEGSRSAPVSQMIPAGYTVTPADANDAQGATREEYVTDPTLNNMKAYSVTIPAKWHFQGAQFQGGPCTSLPFRVWRATSPDGLSKVERMPVMAWVWGTGPMAQHKPEGCLPLSGPMSAQDFLRHVAMTMQVEYVADEPIPAQENASAQKEQQGAAASVAGRYAQMGVAPPKNTVDLARATVRYRNGSFNMKGLLNVTVHCMENTYPGAKGVATVGGPGRLPTATMVTGPPSTMDQCTAGLNYFVAPEEQFAGIMKQWQAPGMMGHSNEAWEEAWTQRATAKVRQMTDDMNRQAAAQRQAQQQQFNHEQAVRQQMHEQFMATMQAGTDRSIARTQAAMNARSTAASDWVDYALDRQTVMDPATGQIAKVSSSYSYTWIDNTGHSYQTNDATANPNGSRTGIWTQQQVVHGDGTQK